MNTFPLFDICERKSRGHRNSQPANQRAQQSAPSMRQRLLDALEERGVEGITGKAFAKLVGKEFNAVSGRLSQAKAAGLIVEVADVEDGAVVVLARLETEARAYWAAKERA